MPNQTQPPIDIDLDALQRVEKYLQERQKARQLDKEHIHGMNCGDPEREGVLLASDLRSLIAGLRKAEAASKWLPIESAPKDGTELALLFAEEDEVIGRRVGRVRAASWCGDWSIPYYRTNPPIAWQHLPQPSQIIAAPDSADSEGAKG